MPMPENYAAFIATFQNKIPETHWPEVLQALWYDGKANWQRAHDMVDGSNEPWAKWVHAYLHRKEGDEWNAAYWYRRADRPYPKNTLEAEFREIVSFVLDQ